MSGSKKTVLVIGGTGAQGAAVVKALSDDSAYEIRVLTRSATSPAAAELAALPDVTIMEGNPYEETTLQHAFDAVDLAWVNTNGFAIGEKNEIYWGIRMYEIARSRGVAHFQWASLPYVSKLGDFDPKYRTGHMDGKGKVADYISAQPTSPMKWTILTSCMYMETLTELLAPRQSPDDPDLTVFAAPLGDGRPPLIYLTDLGRYARWVFDNPGSSNGMNLMVATESVGWEYLAKTFTEVTGKRAIFKDISLDELFTSGAFPFPDGKVGHSVLPEDPTLQSYRQNFSGFWNTWKADLVKVDYALLDDILPTRVKTLSEWMKLVGYTGERRPVLKDYRDNAKQRQQGFENMKLSS
ncbi:NmrA-like family domain-containing protein 1 [Fusarium oxysporum f. sp. rapae]|uniref:NmrA-like family domain-containing protein 1 n=1 Tax=Fusarium oxysporum f. sp. rapae TaxID=485398 RepID=A0A8J5TMJ4_FUSOX|nr:NmrA-like family domain-containing protein 1 [Fusarium oxysporum f. sp. rapae]